MDLTTQRMVSLLLTKRVKATGISLEITDLRDFVFEEESLSAGRKGIDERFSTGGFNIF